MPANLHPCRISPAALAVLTWAVAGIVMMSLAADPPASDKRPAELSGKVVAVHDADTITVLAGRQQYKVRLAAIDAPELSQDFGRKAKQALSSKVFGKQVRVETAGRDRYERVLGTVQFLPSVVKVTSRA